MSDTSPIRVVVLTCSSLGYETARHLATLPEVADVTVVESPPLRPASRWRRLRRAYRHFGPVGLVGAALRKVLPGGGGVESDVEPPGSHIRVDSFHSADGLMRLEALAPDLAVVDGTYILKESTFTVPRLGTINLHCGYLPEYKGSPPVFWELMNGEDSVGVSVHFVTADLDGGPIIARRRFPIDSAPAGDPMEYARGVWRDVLRPAGIEMLGQAVSAASRGELRGVPQVASGKTFRYPGHKQVRELRRAVRLRRQGPAGS